MAIKEHRPSAAKAAVAQQKPRDASGRFLSGAELQAYQIQQQQSQQAAERARLGALFGRTPTSDVQAQPLGPPTNFDAIIQANKPRGMASNLEEGDKWDMLLGRKKRGGLL